MGGIFADGGLLVKAIFYIVASKQEQVEKAVEIFRERYPKVKFAGYRNGYFASEQEMDGNQLSSGKG